MFTEGQPPDAVYVILSGEVVVLQNIPESTLDEMDSEPQQQERDEESGRGPHHPSHVPHHPNPDLHPPQSTHRGFGSHDSTTGSPPKSFEQERLAFVDQDVRRVAADLLPFMHHVKPRYVVY